MARGRMINNKISVSYRVNKLPGDAPLLYCYIVSHLDVCGRYFGDPNIIKGKVFPLRKASVAQVGKWLELMEQAVDDQTGLPLLFRYEVNGNKYMEMPGFSGEQIGLRADKETPEFPPPNTEVCRKICGKDRSECPLKGKGRGREGEEEQEGESITPLNSPKGEDIPAGSNSRGKEFHIYECIECREHSQFKTTGKFRIQRTCHKCEKSTVFILDKK